MDDLYYKIQAYLQKKDQECGRLQFLASRTTEENIKHVDDICETISGLLRTFQIFKGPISKNNQNCVQLFKYLVLNTAFESQTLLIEDIIHGHLVDMCPPLSPYLLLEILQHINYEEILAESILYVPLDLCVEILEICRSYLEYLNFNRALDTLTALISNAYIKFIITKSSGSQTSCFEEFSERFVIAIQELISLLSSEKIIRLDEVSKSRKHERCGIILKKILKMVRNTLESDKINLVPDKEKLYKISFGNDSPIKGNEEIMQRYLNELNQDMMNLLLKKIKEIDCNIYLSWAEIDYENSSVSLQRSIGIDCFYFIEAMKSSVQLPKFQHLLECLNQLASKPDLEIPLSELSLEEVCSKAEGKKEYITELMKRYKYWNESIFSCIEKNESHLDKNDCLYLLEYLHFIVEQSDEEVYKQRVYAFVTKVLILQSIIDLFSITIHYLLNHDGSDILECNKTEENFENFITHNVAFNSPKNLRFVLISIIKNPKKILSILLKMVIGHPNYDHVMISPTEFFLLAPILKIRTENKKTLLMDILADCMQKTEWNIKKFAHFVQVMEENEYGADELFNDLFIPYLDFETFNTSNIKSVLNCARKMQNKCTENLRIDGLMKAIVKKMSYLRKDVNLPKYVNGEILCLLIRVVHLFMENKSSWCNADKKQSVINGISIYLEPIDRPYFCSLWHLTKQGVDIRDIMEDYERRCFIAMNKVKDQGITERLRSHLDDFSFLNEDFLRHFILRSTEPEYTKFGTDIVLLYFNDLKWQSEMEAFDNFIRITIEGCLLCLEFPDVSSPQSFPFLIKCLSRLSKSIFKLDVPETHKSIYQSLNTNIMKLDNSIENSQYSDSYRTFLISINNFSCKEPLANLLLQLIDAIHNFGCQCLELIKNENVKDKNYTPEVVKFRIAHEFISNAIKISAEEAYICMTKMEELLFSGNYEKEKREESIHKPV